MTYKLLLSGKDRVEVKGQSASEAMQRALVQNPGKVVLECYSGNKEWHTVHTPVATYDAPPAWIDYEVPPHFPYLPEDKGPPADPPAMFDFMADVPAIEPPAKPVTRKRQVAAKERTHA